ncbi:MAG: alanyl-tRNA editing protein [Candidatus Eisenbacteria bacterium]
MSSVRRYYDDGDTRAFTARVVTLGEHAGRPAVELEESWFYPESGGQLGDHGRLGAARVLDVQAEGAGRIWHLVDSLPQDAQVECEIDWARRFDHVQQHTGQHILSAALENILDVPTLSSSLGEDRCVIEVGLDSVDWRQIQRVEAAVHEVLWENRELRLHWTDAEGIGQFPLRRPAKVSGRIRVVEVPDWDFSACGGTHAHRTGEVGVVKVIGWEKVRGNVRLAFQCGGRAVADHAWRTETMLEAAKRRSSSDRDLIAHLERAVEEREELRKRVVELNTRLIAEEARAANLASPTGVTAWWPERSREDVRTFATQCLLAGAPWVACAAASPAPALVVGRAKGSTLDLKAMLPQLLVTSGGKGGGSPDLLMLAPADAPGAQAALAWLRDRLG